MSDAEKSVLAAMIDLEEAIEAGGCDGPAAEAIRDRMDGPWCRLTAAEQARVRRVAAALNRPDPAPADSPPVPTEGRCVMAKQADKPVSTEAPDDARHDADVVGELRGFLGENKCPCPEGTHSLDDPAHARVWLACVFRHMLTTRDARIAELEKALAQAPPGAA